MKAIADADLAIRLWDETERALHERGAAYDRDPSTMWIEPFRVSGNLYYVGDRVVCAHLLDTGAGLVLFDSGFPHAASQLLENIAGLGYDPADIRYVLHTHEHFDHFGCTRRLQTEYGARTFLHEDGARTFRLHPHHTELQSAHCPDASLFIPDVELKDGDTIGLGDAVISCLHTPGHSAGAVTYFFDLEEGGRRIRAALCGVNGNIPLHPGRLLKYGIPLSAGDQYLASIDTLLDADVDLTLDTHPRPHGIVERHLAGIRDHADREAWNRNLQDYRTRYLAMIERFEARIDEERPAGTGRD